MATLELHLLDRSFGIVGGNFNFTYKFTAMKKKQHKNKAHKKMKPLNQNNMLEKLNIDVSQFWEIIWKFFVGAIVSGLLK